MDPANIASGMSRVSQDALLRIAYEDAPAIAGPIALALRQRGLITRDGVTTDLGEAVTTYLLEATE